MKSEFLPGETLDALVIPPEMGGYDKGAILSWVKELRKEFPKIKVIADGVHLQYSDPEQARRMSRFAYPLQEEAQIRQPQRKMLVSPDNPDFALAEGIDLATCNLSKLERVNILRTQIGVEPLSPTSALGRAG